MFKCLVQLVPEEQDTPQLALYCPTAPLVLASPSLLPWLDGEVSSLLLSNELSVSERALLHFLG